MLDQRSDELPGGAAPATELRGRMEECHRLCRAEGLPFFLLAIGWSGDARMEAERPGVTPRIRAALLERIAELPRADDLLVGLEDGRLIVVVPDLPAEAAEVVSQLLIAGARELVIEGEAEPQRVSLEIGIAIEQERDLHFETLVQVALEGSKVARARGGECAIHSELYGLVQNRIDRKRREAAGQPPIPAAHPAPATPEPESEPAAEPAAEEPAGDGADERERLAAELQQIVARDASRRSRRELEAELRRRVEEYATEAVAKAEAERRRVLADDSAVTPASRVSAGAPVASITAPEDHSQVELLERRLAKLARTLEDTERRLAEVSARKGLDHGVESAYRTVQGLSGDEDDFELKRALMRKILDANLRLREELGENESAA